MKHKKNLRLNNTLNQWDSVFRRISIWDANKVSQAKVIVVGAGALGNEVLKNLALLNIGSILIIDFDLIEYSNLSRSILYRTDDCGKSKAEVATEKLRAINPNIDVNYIYGDIGTDVGLGVFRRTNVVIGCLDNLIARRSINRLCFRVGKTWVDGAIENLAGQMRVYKPGVSCFECQLEDKELERISFREGCADVAERNATFGRTPTTPISASIIGALQVQEAIKMILGYEEELMAEQKFWFEGMHNAFFKFSPNLYREDCLSHSNIESNIIEIKEINCRMLIGELLSFFEKYFKTNDIKIMFNTDIVLEVAGSKSQIAQPLIMLKNCIKNEQLEQYKKTLDESILITKNVRAIDQNFPGKQLRLTDIGVPPLQVLEVIADKHLHFIELAGDESFLNF